MTYILKLDKPMCPARTSCMIWRTIVSLAPSNRLINNLFKAAQIFIIGVVLTMIAMSI